MVNTTQLWQVHCHREQLTLIIWVSSVQLFAGKACLLVNVTQLLASALQL